MTFAEIAAALDAGKLEMRRPHGDWILVRRRKPTRSGEGGVARPDRICVWMEGQVQACIHASEQRFGFSGIRIAK